MDDTCDAAAIAEGLHGPDTVGYGDPSMPAGVCRVSNEIVVPAGHPEVNYAIAERLAKLELDAWAIGCEETARDVAVRVIAPAWLVRHAAEHLADIVALAAYFDLSTERMTARLRQVREEDGRTEKRSGHFPVVRSLVKSEPPEPHVEAHSA